MKRSFLKCMAGAGLLTLAALSAAAQTGAKNGEWTSYGADLGNTRYSPLDQISADNFSKLQVAWRFKTESLGPRVEYNLEATPLMAKGVVYSVGGKRRASFQDEDSPIGPTGARSGFITLPPATASSPSMPRPATWCRDSAPMG